MADSWRVDCRARTGGGQEAFAFAATRLDVGSTLWFSTGATPLTRPQVGPMGELAATGPQFLTVAGDFLFFIASSAGGRTEVWSLPTAELEATLTADASLLLGR